MAVVRTYGKLYLSNLIHFLKHESTDTEIKILNRLLSCRYLPGSFDKKFPKQIDTTNVSPLQKYWIYKLGYKYRKQIRNDILETICKNYIDSNTEPLSRKQAQKLLKISC